MKSILMIAIIGLASAVNIQSSAPALKNSTQTTAKKPQSLIKIAKGTTGGPGGW